MKRSRQSWREIAIVIEHVRSFSERQAVPLRPLTLLVGENSSGKSTFLSVVSAVLDVSRFPTAPGFNEPPYHLGNFDHIASLRSGKQPHEPSFSIGFSAGVPGDGEYREAVATYGSDYGGVALRQFDISSALGTLTLSISPTSISGKVSLPNGHRSQEIPFEQR